MAHFAKIENNIVTQVIVIGNDDCGEPTLGFPDTEGAGRAFIADTLKLDGTWKQTSFNNNFRGIYAGIGYTYDSVNDVFVAPQPFPSWTLDSNHDWQPPTPMPVEEGKEYAWFEPNQQWIELV
jgi:hypothetical protein